jgi:ferredoxin
MSRGAKFTRLCTRCGACVRTCPAGIIRFGGAGAGWAGVLAPEVSFDGGYCPPSCARCGGVCPSGAIPRFTRQTKHARPMGAVRWNENDCFLSMGRECGACVGACPYGALDLTWDPVNMTSRVVADLALCTGCGCCEYVCPTSPKAIRVVGNPRVECRGSLVKNHMGGNR